MEFDMMKYFNYGSETVSDDESRWYVDSLANMSFTGNADMVLNVHDTIAKVETMGGVVSVGKCGYLPMIGEVYIGDNCKVNGIGLCILVDLCNNDWYVNGNQWIFNINRGGKCIKLIFTRDKLGYGCIIDKIMMDKLQDMENMLCSYTSNKVARVSNNVNENKKLFSKKQLVRAGMAMDYWGALGFVSEGWYKKLLRNGTVSNIPFDITDIDNAIEIYGRPTYQSKGILKYQKKMIKTTKIEFRNDNQILYSDVMMWCKKSYLISIARPMYLVTVYNLPHSYNQDDIFACWNLCIKLFNTYGVTIDKIVCDGDSKFVAIKDAWCVGVPIENVGAYQHNSIIEVEIRIVKERMRCMMAKVGWKVPGILIDSLTVAATSILNVIPRVNETVGARQKLTGQNVDYNQMKFSWGQYGQGYIRSTQINNDNFRSQGVIVLYPKFNESGSYLGLSLNTRKFVTVSQFVPSPTPDDVIEYLNNWFHEDVIEHNMRLNKTDAKLLDKEAANERKVKKQAHKKKNTTKVEINTVREPPLHSEDDHSVVQLNPLKEDYDVSNIEVQGSGVGIYLGCGDEVDEDVEMDNEVNITTMNSGEINRDMMELEGSMMNTCGQTGTARPSRRRNKPSRYMYGANERGYMNYYGEEENIPSRYMYGATERGYMNYYGKEENRPSKYMYGAMGISDNNKEEEYIYDERGYISYYGEEEMEECKYSFTSSIKLALNEGGREVEDAIGKEFKQLIEKEVWEYVNMDDQEGINHYSQLSPRPIKSLLNVDKKYDANGVFTKWKARFCACGNHQDRDLYDEEDLSSPTMSLESIFILISFAAQWDAHIATADITGAYLESSLEPNDIVYMFLSKDSVDQLKKLDPKIIKHVMADGRALVRLLKALYGTIQAAKLWYRKLKEIFTSYGFRQHPHDQCVFVYVRNGILMVVGFHVDDLLMICKERNMIDDFIAYLLTCVTNVTVHYETQQTYLGMLISKEDDNTVCISMDGYIEKVLMVYNLSEDQTVKDPQQDNIFKIDVQSPILNESKRKIFHKVVYMLVYLGKRVRFDIQMAVSFLAGRVTIATEEDEGKLSRVLRFLHNSMGEKIYFRGKDYVDECGNSTMDVKVWADSSWGCHDDGTSRSAIIICVNDSCVASYTYKQKMITLHATEAELVCLTDAARLGTWTRMFVEHIVQLMNNNDVVLIMTMMQDNESVIKIQAAGQRNKQRTRHLTIRLWWTQELVEAGFVRIEWIGTKLMIADFLTKALHGVSFKYCWNVASGNVMIEKI